MPGQKETWLGKSLSSGTAVSDTMSEPVIEHPSSAGREAGVLVHITSLPGPWGIGEIGAHARAFVERMCAMKLSVWQFLPTGPTAYGDSPYQALSTFAGN